MKKCCAVSSTISRPVLFEQSCRAWSRRLEIKHCMTTRLSLSLRDLSARTATFACWRLGHNELIRPLKGFVFCPAGWHTTPLTGHSWWGSRFSRQRLIHGQVAMGYSVTSSRVWTLNWSKKLGGEQYGKNKNTKPSKSCRSSLWKHFDWKNLDTSKKKHLSVKTIFKVLNGLSLFSYLPPSLSL